MGISRKKSEKWQQLEERDRRRILDMCWEDRSTFDDIFLQFRLSPNEVVQFMRKMLSPNNYKRWRRRAQSQGRLKHRKTRAVEVSRYKCSRQRFDGSTKGWK